MRRDEIVQAVRNLREALKASRVLDIIGPESRRAEGRAAGAVLSAFREYSILQAKFGATEKQLIDILGIGYIDNTEFWAAMAANAVDPEMFQQLHFVQQTLPRIVNLLEQDTLRIIAASSDKDPHAKKGLLSVFVIEEERLFSTPLRLSIVLQSVSDLYDACALIEGIAPERLSVIACDSGSDKSFDFLGAAKAIDCVKEVILSLWDRIVFYRERKIANQLELVAQALPILDRIAEMEKATKIGPEQAEILRRQITGGCMRFIEAGAMIPEISKASTVEPRLLLAPEPKLLASPEARLDGESGAPPSPTPEVYPDLSPEERADLMTLLRERRKKKSEE